MNAKTCLMIETPNKQKFFTHSENYTDILEFANCFNCEISSVNLEQGEVLELEPLAEAITSNSPIKRAKFEILETVKPRRYNRRRN